MAGGSAAISLVTEMAQTGHARRQALGLCRKAQSVAKFRFHNKLLNDLQLLLCGFLQVNPHVVWIWQCQEPCRSVTLYMCSIVVAMMSPNDVKESVMRDGDISTLSTWGYLL